MAWIIGLVSDRERLRLEKLGHKLRSARDVCDEIVEGQDLDEGDECPHCQGTLQRKGDELVCRCGAVFIDQDLRGLNVDNDLFALVDDAVQFARLLCAIDDDNMVDCGGNGLGNKQIDELFKRARELWERARPPADFGAQMAEYVRRGLGADEILEKLDPDTAGVDLIELVKGLMG